MNVIRGSVIAVLRLHRHTSRSIPAHELLERKGITNYIEESRVFVSIMISGINVTIMRITFYIINGKLLLF